MKIETNAAVDEELEAIARATGQTKIEVVRRALGIYHTLVTIDAEWRADGSTAETIPVPRKDIRP